jgi:hypothetical protein
MNAVYGNVTDVRMILYLQISYVGKPACFLMFQHLVHRVNHWNQRVYKESKVALCRCIWNVWTDFRPSAPRIKPDRQCTYNVTMRRVHKTIVAVEKQQVLHIRLCVCVCVCVCVFACNLAYPACNAYAPYCVVCGLSGSTIFFDITS